jgi:transcription antitermination factor NusG
MWVTGRSCNNFMTMSTTTVLQQEHSSSRIAPARFRDDALVLPDQSNWYAAYTRANHEHRVSSGLTERGVEHFLPQYKSLRKWKDRQILLSRPLFPGYVFVHLALQNRLQVLQVPGVASLVGFAGKPAVVPEDEFARIRELLNRTPGAAPHPFLRVGRRARVLDGPFAGLEGIIVRRNNRKRLVISLEMIERSVAVELGEASLQAIA